MENKCNFERYDILKVLGTGLFTYEHLIIFELLLSNIEAGAFNSTKNIDGKIYYIVNIPKLVEEDGRFLTKPDNVLRKVKALKNNGYLSMIKGNWNDQKVGYTQFAIRIKNTKLKHILRDGE